MSQEDYLVLPQLLAQLQGVLDNEQTGTFLIATHDNASCRLAIHQGRITHSTYRRLHGEEAVGAMTQIHAGRCSFAPGRVYPFRPHAALKHEVAMQLLFALSTDAALADVKEPQAKQKQVLPSGFTKQELEMLFGNFYFE